MIKTILFDLDGTLLPMETDTLLNADLSGMCVHLKSHGYAPELLGKAFHRAMHDMIHNDGTQLNVTRFWQPFYDLFGDRIAMDKTTISFYYEQEFSTLKAACGYDPRANETIRMIREMGYQLVLATNPFFPPSMIQARLQWAGVEPEHFSYITTFDNSSYCKPNPAYYSEIMEKLDLNAEECLMVGNDVTEDMIAGSIGMKTFLLTDCIINRENRDIGQWPHGSFPDLMKYMQELQI